MRLRGGGIGRLGPRGGRTRHFADRLAALVEERRSQVVLGLDPDPAELWPAALESAGASASGGGGRVAATADPAQRAELTGAAVARHCRAAIEAAASACVAVKLQLACFERLGSAGWTALEHAAAAGREHGLLVIADGKRGDVPVTARAYSQALCGQTPSPYGSIPGLGADAFTVNPLLGPDSLEPFVEAAAATGSACFVLVRTSNPGAEQIQDVPAPRKPLHERLAGLVDAHGAAAIGDSGLSAVGAVAGATRPELLGRLRELMPRAIFLLPGVGAQGGSVDSLAPAFAPHPAAGLITASRSIVGAHEGTGDPATAALEAAERLRAAAWSLGR